MGRRDWAGTVLIACLAAAAGLLRVHTVLLVCSCTGAVASALFIAWDVWHSRRLRRVSQESRPLVKGGVRSIQQALRVAAAAECLLGYELPPEKDSTPPENQNRGDGGTGK